MTNYNGRLDQILSEQLHKMSYDIEAYGITDCKNYLPDYKQALTSLIKELVAEAKPYRETIIDKWNKVRADEANATNATMNAWADIYEQNILKALEQI